MYMKQKKKDKWGKKQVFIVTANPYKQEVVVILNGQFSDAIKFLKKCKTKNAEKNLKHIEEEQKKDPDNYADDYVLHIGRALLYTELPFGYVMVLSHSNNWIESVESVAHESLHLVHYINRNVGITLCKESEEASTYLQGYIMTQILEKMY